MYMPNTQTHGQPRVRGFIEYLTSNFPFTSNCYNIAVRTLCTHYYLSCGYNGTIHVPRFLCPDVCTVVSTQLCPEGWKILQGLSSKYSSYSDSLRLPECDDTDSLIENLHITSDCCFNGGIMLSSCKK